MPRNVLEDELTRARVLGLIEGGMGRHAACVKAGGTAAQWQGYLKRNPDWMAEVLAAEQLAQFDVLDMLRKRAIDKQDVQAAGKWLAHVAPPTQKKEVEIRVPEAAEPAELADAHARIAALEEAYSEDDPNDPFGDDDDDEVEDAEIVEDDDAR